MIEDTYDSRISMDTGSVGNLFLSTNQISLAQKQTQKNAGGMTESYLDFGTYVKSFYSILYHPSSVKISTMNSTHMRIHHLISWENTVPKILAPPHPHKI